MAQQITWNYNDTAADPSHTTVQIPLLQWAADWSRLESKPNEVRLTNLTSAVGIPETVRFAYQRVNNVYSGTGIDPSAYAPSRQGFSLLSQINDILSITDDATNLRIDLPITAHLVIRGPLNAAITGERLKTVLVRLIGTLTEGHTGTLDQRLDAMVRGALLPKALI